MGELHLHGRAFERARPPRVVPTGWIGVVVLLAATTVGAGVSSSSEEPPEKQPAERTEEVVPAVEPADAGRPSRVLGTENLSRFQQAQRLAWSGKRRQARDLCQAILQESPRHHDARILMARTHAWDREYEPARRELEHVLHAKPDYVDAYRALADTELWDERAERALEVSSAGLAYEPADIELRYRQVQALEKLDRDHDALALSEQLEQEHPDDDRFSRMSRRLQVKLQRWWATLGYRYEDFDEFSEPWQEWNVAIKNRQRWGSWIARIRQARRFGTRGEQLEVDAYPKAGRGFYLYTNLGIGEDPFPQLRSGAEAFKSLGNGWEASLGLRYLDFGTSEVTIYTGSASLYFRNYWVSVRPIFTPKERGYSETWSITLRHYLSADSWVGGTFSLGSKPDPILVAGVGAYSDTARLDSNRLGVAGQFKLSDWWQLKANVGYREQQVSASNQRRSYVGSLSVTRAF